MDPDEVVAIESRLYKLSTLNSPEEVAHCLHALGCNGLPGVSLYCPVAKYLDPDGRVTVGLGRIYIEEEIVHALPAHVRQFVRNFDDGKYPELEEGESP